MVLLDGGTGEVSGVERKKTLDIPREKSRMVIVGRGGSGQTGNPLKFERLFNNSECAARGPWSETTAQNPRSPGVLTDATIEDKARLKIGEVTPPFETN